MRVLGHVDEHRKLSSGLLHFCTRVSRERQLLGETNDELSVMCRGMSSVEQLRGRLPLTRMHPESAGGLSLGKFP
jgi:hypothetical protein